jgi:hypothetical protein
VDIVLHVASLFCNLHYRREEIPFQEIDFCHHCILENKRPLETRSAVLFGLRPNIHDIYVTGADASTDSEDAERRVPYTALIKDNDNRRCTCK